MVDVFSCFGGGGFLLCVYIYVQPDAEVNFAIPVEFSVDLYICT